MTIDVWDVATFDFALATQLEANADVIRDYLHTDHQIFLSHDLGRGARRSILRPENPYADDFYALKDAIGREMEMRAIRAFHYTRLTDDEIANLTRNGLHLSTPETLRDRLDAVVTAGGLTQDLAEKLYVASPFRSDQLEARSGKFWMASHPTAIDDSGIAPLLERWGGEVASMWVQDDALSSPLKSLGKPRIIEVAVPLSATRHGHDAGMAVIASFARSRGSIPSKHAFDLFIEQRLPSTAILTVLSDGDRPFATMGRGYPAGFVDVDLGRWKELTGEDD
ncbi:hypothetical protein GOA97_00055 [Sinorhizobium meliloti]|nr:hypothetical protein [Sinorhizobium meliloti]MDW9912865.1 hypothetical protein [Sinorhizobium meliloti]MDW9943967.1 hypothetical protein [Sinorhizobium meliloti]